MIYGIKQIITLERLFKNTYGKGLNYQIYSIPDNRERLRCIVENTKVITGLEDFGAYMSKLLTIDSFFLNEDRHTHNIAVLLDDNGVFDYCPIFDNGASLLSDIAMDYPLSEDVYELMYLPKSKTFCDDFDEQLDIAEELYGEHIRFSFTQNDVMDILQEVKIYDDKIKKRVETLIFQQMHKYKYLFD